MEFSKSGLPKVQLIEDAFNHSRQHTRVDYDIMLETFNEDIEMMTKNRLMVLNAGKDAGKMSETEYEQSKKKIEQERQQYLKVGPELINRELEGIFEARAVARAKTVLASSGNASHEFAAAMLLLDCVRSPIDHDGIVKKFGKNVAALVAEVAHLDAYPGKRIKALSQASTDAKRAVLVTLISDTDLLFSRVERTMKANPGKKPPSVGSGEEKKAFEDFKAVFGNDAKLDAKFVDSFNKLAALTLSTYRVEVSNGNLALVNNPAGVQEPGKRPRNNKPTGPKNPDDIF